MDGVPLVEGSSILLLATKSAATWLDNLQHVSTMEWVAISISLVCSMVFSASETALTALNLVKLDHLIAKDPKRYSRFKLWKQVPNRVLTTILIGNNLVNILASALATSIATRIFSDKGSEGLAVSVSVGVMTFAILVFGEVIPKTYAKHHAEKVASWVMPLLRLVYWMFLPFTWVLVRLATYVVRLFGGDINKTGPFVTAEDIQFMIDLGSREGVFDGEKEKMLQSVFEFDDITCREIMQPRTSIIGWNIDATTEEIIALALDSSYSRIPVYKENLDHIEGILYIRDLFRSKLDPESVEGQEESWTELVRPAFFVPGTMKVSGLLREFQKRKLHMAVLVDEYGGTMGLVTLEDVVEEIVGEIVDEYDEPEQQEFVEISEGVYHVNASISLRELEEHLNVEFPDDGDFETLGGFLTADAGMVPTTGETLCWRGFSFRIEEGDEKRVTRVEIQHLDEDEEELSENETAA